MLPYSAEWCLISCCGVVCPGEGDVLYYAQVSLSLSLALSCFLLFCFVSVVVLRCVAFCCVVLSCVALCCVVLRCVVLNCAALCRVVFFFVLSRLSLSLFRFYLGFCCSPLFLKQPVLRGVHQLTPTASRWVFPRIVHTPNRSSDFRTPWASMAFSDCQPISLQRGRIGQAGEGRCTIMPQFKLYSHACFNSVVALWTRKHALFSWMLFHRHLCYLSGSGLILSWAL